MPRVYKAETGEVLLRLMVNCFFAVAALLLVKWGTGLPLHWAWIPDLLALISLIMFVSNLINDLWLARARVALNNGCEQIEWWPPFGDRLTVDWETVTSIFLDHSTWGRTKPVAIRISNARIYIPPMQPSIMADFVSDLEGTARKHNLKVQKTYKGWPL